MSYLLPVSHTKMSSFSVALLFPWTSALKRQLTATLKWVWWSITQVTWPSLAYHDYPIVTVNSSFACCRDHLVVWLLKLRCGACVSQLHSLLLSEQHCTTWDAKETIECSSTSHMICMYCCCLIHELQNLHLQCSSRTSDGFYTKPSSASTLGNGFKSIQY